VIRAVGATASGRRVGRAKHRVQWIAWGLAVLGVLLFVSTIWLGFARGNAHVAGVSPLTWLDVISMAPFLAFPILGAVILSKYPRQRLGWILCAAGLSTFLGNFTSEYALAALVLHRSLPLGGLGAWLSYWDWAPGSTVVPLTLLLVPDGRLLSPRWRWVAVAAVINLFAVMVVQMFAPDVSGQAPFANPIGTPALVPAARFLFVAEGLVLVALLLLSVGSFILRYRRADSEVRHQLKWLMYAFVLVPIGFIFGALPDAGNGTGALAIAHAVLQFISIMAVSFGFAIAILKYRLYDFDMVISRTLVYGSLAVCITAVYVGIAVGIGAAIGGGGRPNLGLSIVATAIVAVGFQPLRERLQRVANRLVYGKRATPYEVLSQFSERVAESYAVDDVLPRMARVLAEGTGAQRADVWLRSGDSLHATAVWPVDAPARDPVALNGSGLDAPEGPDRMVAVRHQGEVLGALSLSKRTGESLTPVEENLLTHLAGQAGLVLKNVGLTADLQARLVELRASRQRLVSAQDEERRRLERNLHDGAQQHLVAIKVKLGLAEMLASRDPEKARATIVQLKGDADEALATLRDLARGIYPPLLAEKGLGAALESQARKATVPVTVDADGTGRYSQDVEAAVYFSVLEALQNVQKYAQASQATVRLREEDGMLRFDVADDGEGFDVTTTAKGSGLINMADRVDALDGAVQLTSEPGRGTRLSGSLPVAAVGAAA
jgi:signal transduction histidine kinase